LFFLKTASCQLFFRAKGPPLFLHFFKRELFRALFYKTKEQRRPVALLEKRKTSPVSLASFALWLPKKPEAEWVSLSSFVLSFLKKRAVPRPLKKWKNIGGPWRCLQKLQNLPTHLELDVLEGHYGLHIRPVHAALHISPKTLLQGDWVWSGCPSCLPRGAPIVVFAHQCHALLQHQQAHTRAWVRAHHLIVHSLTVRQILQLEGWEAHRVRHGDLDLGSALSTACINTPNMVRDFTWWVLFPWEAVQLVHAACPSTCATTLAPPLCNSMGCEYNSTPRLYEHAESGQGLVIERYRTQGRTKNTPGTRSSTDGTDGLEGLTHRLHGSDLNMHIPLTELFLFISHWWRGKDMRHLPGYRRPAAGWGASRITKLDMKAILGNMAMAFAARR